MLLDDTLNLGTGLNFNQVSQLSGSSVVYYAASPSGDLSGRPSFRVSHEASKAGIMRSLVSIQIPILNSVSNKYDSFIKTDLVVNRPITSPIADALTSMVAIQTFLGDSGWQSIIAQAAV